MIGAALAFTNLTAYVTSRPALIFGEDFGMKPREALKSIAAEFLKGECGKDWTRNG